MHRELLSALAVSVALVAGCSDDESTDDGSDDDSGIGDTGADGDTGGDGDTGDGGGSGDDGGGTGDTGASGTSDTHTGGDDGATGSGSCGDDDCEVGQICVLPCCGGAPGCYPANADGECQPGDMPIDAADCMAGCDADPCCEGSCEPAPPYCIDEGDLICGGEIGDQCSTPNGDCYGTKVGNELQCSCG